MSVFGTLNDKIIELIKENTSVKDCVVGYKQYQSQNYPIAQIALTDGVVQEIDSNYTVDLALNLYVMVDGNTYEETMLIVEDIFLLFFTNTDVFNDLHTLGVISIFPTAMTPPFRFDGQFAGYKADVTFALVHRRNYTT
jgi:hypothetical protein